MGRKTNVYTDSEAAVKLGFHHNHFSVLKKASPVRFKYIVGCGENLFDAYNSYLDEMSEVKYEAGQNHYWLEDRAKISEFGRFLKDEGVYGSDRSYSSSAPEMLFNSVVGFGQHKGYMTYKKIVPLFEKFKEVNKDEPWVK